MRGYGQRNPLLEYKREAFQMYQMMSAMRDEEVLKRIYGMNTEAVKEASERPAVPQRRSLPIQPKRAADVFANVPESNGAGPVEIPEPPPVAAPPAEPKRPAPGEEARVFAEMYGIKRNDPCPCGSGNKFKKCCYKKDAPASQPGA